MRVPIRRRLGAVLLVPAAVAAMGLSACGGSDSDKSAQQLLDTAFGKAVESADVALDAQLKLNGGSSATGPVRVRAEGPYRDKKGKLPAVDFDLSVSTGGGGQQISTGFLSTGDRAFVKFQDAYYEQPKAQVDEANRSLSSRENKQGSLKALGLDPRTWLVGAKKQGDEEVAGVQTTHVTGRLDVTNLMTDFNKLLQRGGGTLGGTGTAKPKPLSEADIKQVADVVKDPSFDVYVGKEDDVIRRVAGKLDFNVPEKNRSQLGGLQGGSLDFSIELSKVGGDQRIEAPTNARPLSDLTKSLGSGALGGLGGGAGQGGSAQGGQTAPPAGGSGTGGSGSGGSATPTPPTGGAGAPDSEAFKRYADCIDKAEPSDRQALQRCANELR